MHTITLVRERKAHNAYEKHKEATNLQQVVFAPLQRFLTALCKKVAPHAEIERKTASTDDPDGIELRIVLPGVSDRIPKAPQVTTQYERRTANFIHAGIEAYLSADSYLQSLGLQVQLNEYADAESMAKASKTTFTLWDCIYKVLNDNAHYLYKLD
mgnify:CR=1 FL=1